MGDLITNLVGFRMVAENPEFSETGQKWSPAELKRAFLEKLQFDFDCIAKGAVRLEVARNTHMGPPWFVDAGLRSKELTVETVETLQKAAGDARKFFEGITNVETRSKWEPVDFANALARLERELKTLYSQIAGRGMEVCPQQNAKPLPCAVQPKPPKNQ